MIPERRRCGTSLLRYNPHCEGTAERFRLDRSASQPEFPIVGRGTNSSNKINQTESTDRLIWTALSSNRRSCSKKGKTE
jgi:hypothetical protein